MKTHVNWNLSLIQDNCESEPNSGCWLWMKGISSSGYGTIKIWRKSKLAHRISYYLKYNTFPYELMHICDTKICVNPDHLRDVTHQQNIQDASRKGLLGPKSENSKFAKINWDVVRAIRADAASGKHSKTIGYKYGLSRHIVRRVINHENWKE